MLRLTTSHRFTAGIASAFVILAANAIAQERGAPLKNAPPKATATPAATPPPPKPALTTKVPINPDLVVEIAPPGGKGVPTSYTVKNIGTGDAGPSILQIKVTLMPIDPSETNTYFLGQPITYGPYSHKDMCNPPVKDFVELIPALKAGESKTIFPTLFLPLVPPAKKPAPQPHYSHFWHGSTPFFVCVFELKATADSGNDVKESNETNNSASRFVEREI